MASLTKALEFHKPFATKQRTRRLTLRASILDSRLRTSSEKKVPMIVILLAWQMLQRKMDNLKLSENEKDLIKQDILHKEAELNRKL